MSITEEIEKLYAMKKEGVISDDEYKAAKVKIIRDYGSRSHSKQALSVRDENIWAMLIHLSQFFSYFIPLGGIIAPILLWQIKKTESPHIDRNGRIVANWLFTYLILFVCFIILSFLLVGIPLLILLIVLGIVFPVIGAIKANDGDAWVYPFSIRFFSLDI